MYNMYKINSNGMTVFLFDFYVNILLVYIILFLVIFLLLAYQYIITSVLIERVTKMKSDSMYVIYSSFWCTIISKNKKII